MMVKPKCVLVVNAADVDGGERRGEERGISGSDNLKTRKKSKKDSASASVVGVETAVVSKKKRFGGEGGKRNKAQNKLRKEKESKGESRRWQ